MNFSAASNESINPTLHNHSGTSLEVLTCNTTAVPERTHRTSQMTTPPPPPLSMVGASSSCSPHRRCRLQRSERLQSGGSDSSPTPPNSAHSHGSSGSGSSSGGGSGGLGGQYSSWEVLIRDSFGQIAWPIKFTSWELIDDNNKLKESVPNR